jgi:uncharacterized protein (TIGR04255 family)
MTDAFPFTIPEPLPSRIEPCPIVEAVFEVRFVSTQPWATMPGLLFALIRERYPEQVELPLAQVPEAIRRENPALQHQALLQFASKDFLIQMGPRMVSLNTKSGTYAGWTAIRTELEWLLEKLNQSGLVRETERLGVRYIDFLAGDIFTGLKLGLQVEDQPLRGVQTGVTVVLRRGALALRLQVNNDAIASLPGGPQAGSVLDMDAWFGSLDVSVFENGLARFDEAHLAIKGVFFGLLRPELLAKFNPVYA